MNCVDRTGAVLPPQAGRRDGFRHGIDRVPADVPLIATIYFTIVPGGGRQQALAAFLATSAVVALDLMVLTLLLRRLPERQFER